MSYLRLCALGVLLFGALGCAARDAVEPEDEQARTDGRTVSSSALTQSDADERRRGDQGGRWRRAIALESVNYPDRLLRHENFLAFLEEIDEYRRLDREDASFVIVGGLAGEGVSFRSVNYPDRYLRHQDYRLKLHRDDGSRLFEEDATFYIGDGLARGGSSLESYNFPGYFLRHRDFEVWLDRRERSSLYRQDATFLIRDAP
jgi:hypothetical protein